MSHVPTEIRRQRLAKATRVTSSARGIARWVAGLEVLLSAIETAAWELRDYYERASLAAVQSWAGVKGSYESAQDQRQNLQVELERLIAISLVVTKTVFSYRWLAIRQAFMSRDAGERALAGLHKKTGRRLYRLSEKLQGGIIKVAQILSVRSDILPAGITEPLSKLQDACAPLPLETVRTILAGGWGERLAEVEVDPEPLGAGSIGQVHKARLPDGREVAVKVLRPGVERILRHDMANLRRVIGALAAYMPDLEITPVIDEIEEQLLREVDLEGEKHALAAFGDLTADMKNTLVPAIVHDWCSADVLVTEMMPGQRIDRALADRNAERVGDVLYTMADLYALQILKWGYFQPDTHPGNFLVDEADRIVMLDFGCVRKLDEPFRRAMLTTVQGFLMNNDTATAEGLSRMGFVTRSGNFDKLIAVAREVLADVLTVDGEWNPDDLVAAGERALDSLLIDPLIRIPQEFIMVGRALMNLGGLFYTHRPQLDLSEILLPLLAEALDEAQ